MGVILSSLLKKGGAMARCLFVVIAAFFLPILCAAQCQTTLAPNPPFVPRGPYQVDAPTNMFWYGTDQLWTVLSSDGKWHMRNNVMKGKRYRTKLTFWRLGFDWRTEAKPRLVVVAMRLDGDAAKVIMAPASVVFIPSREAAGIMAGIDIPSAGCWEVTAQYGGPGGHRLTFVVSVEP
jgi:hypothetical protein